MECIRARGQPARSSGSGKAREAPGHVVEVDSLLRVEPELGRGPESGSELEGQTVVRPFTMRLITLTSQSR